MTNDWIILRDNSGRPLHRAHERLELNDRAQPTIRAVCVAHGLTPALLLGKSRERVVAYARHDLMARLRALGWSLPKIGYVLKLNHTSVMHGLKAHAARVGVNSTSVRAGGTTRRSIGAQPSVHTWGAQPMEIR